MKKKTFKKLLFLGGTATLLLSGTSYYLHIHSPEHTMNTAQKSSTQKTKKTKEKAEVLLDVPLESQFDSPSLENGCEVTSLSMLLSFYGYETTKNQLAEQLDYIPVFNADGTHGVYVPPVASLAQQIVQTDYHTFPKTDAQLDDIKKALSKGNPVWTSVTINFEVPDETDFMTWTTNNGEVRVTPLVHACVVTGYDKENIYVNDPYGVKNRAVPINDFSAIFTAMGGQMLTLEKS